MAHAVLPLLPNFALEHIINSKKIKRDWHWMGHVNFSPVLVMLISVARI